MPRDTNGNMTRVQAYVPGTKARASDVNTNEADMAAEISDSLSRSGKGKMLRAIGVDEGGTGATAASDARANLGAASKAGEAFTGDVLVPLLKIKNGGNRTLYFVNGADAVRGYVFQDSATEDLIFSRETGGTLRMSGSVLAYTAALQGTAFNVFSDGNRVINFGTAAGGLRGYLFQDSATDDLILSRASGQTLRMSTVSLRFNGTFDAALMRILSDNNRNLAFGSADGTARGFLFSDSTTNDMILSRATGETLRVSAAWLDYNGLTQSRGVRVIADSNRTITFASLDGTARGYLFQDVATDDMILSKADGSATIRIGTVGFTYNGAPVTLLGDIRSRHISRSEVDGITLARIGTSGQTVVLAGNDIAGSDLHDAYTGGSMQAVGTWRCLGSFGVNSIFVHLVYRYV